MTDTTDSADQSAAAAAARTRSGLTAMKIADLKGLASQLGITGTAKMRKDDLVSAISGHQGGSGSRPAARRESRTDATSESSTTPSTTPSTATPSDDVATQVPARGSRRAESRVTTPAPATQTDPGAGPARPERSQPEQPELVAADGGDAQARRSRDHSSRDRGAAPSGDRDEVAPIDRSERSERSDRPDRPDRSEASDRQPPRERAERPAGAESRTAERQAERQADREERQANRAAREQPQERVDRQPAGGQPTGGQQTGGQQAGGQARQGTQPGSQGGGTAAGGQQTRGQGASSGQQNRAAQAAQAASTPQGQTGGGSGPEDEDDRTGGRRRNRQRSRDRKRRGTTQGSPDDEPELQIADDDILVPVAGILDVLDNYAFVRTSGYLAGPNDVYVPLGLVKKYGLRKGDAVTGAVKALREGEQLQGTSTNGRQKFNALVRLDTINGMSPEESRTRAEFGKLTPLYPQDRLRLETETSGWTTRVIDLVAPIGKGQRGLVVAPAKAGKTMVMQAIANAVTANNPECHLMVVLVDERPEEVTEMQRAVKGEVIASTFDRPADDHTTVAELSIERAKRLVELGHDVVVLLDSITKLGRAYNLSAAPSGRILSGGVDSAALYPPKKFFGAARNIENGGSLTIIATALVETGSRMDEVIFEEFKGTGNMELRLSRELANRRVFPAVDVNASGTRREELLLGGEELKIIWKLRRVLGALDSQQAMDLLLGRLKKTRSNIEFLRQVQATSSNGLGDD